MRETSLFRQKLFYSFGNFGNGVYNGFNNAILSLFVTAFTSNPLIIGYLSNTRTFEGVIIQPLVGRISDRTTNRLGRRRPFILFGIPISVAFLLLVPTVGHLSHNIALPVLVVTIILFSIFWNIAGDPYQALMIDITPERERSVFNAILSVIALVGQVAILLYAAKASIKKDTIPDVVFYTCAIFLLASYIVVFFGVHEPKQAIKSAEVEAKIPLRQSIRELRVFTEANKLLISIFFLWSGLNAIIPYLTVYTKKTMGATNSKALIIYLIVILSSAIFAYPFGRLGARYGNRRFIIVGTVILIVAAIGGIFAPSYTSLYPVAILAGLGFSATTALTYPYLSQLVPGSKIGVFTGLQAAFSSVALPLSVAVTSALIHFFQYRSIFAMLAVMMVVDVYFLSSIDEDVAKYQVRQVENKDAQIRTELTSLAPL
ncbi:MAG: SLC45 family MFS transporter [Chloroflexota bacterium]